MASPQRLAFFCCYLALGMVTGVQSSGSASHFLKIFSSSSFPGPLTALLPIAHPIALPAAHP